MNIFDKKVAIKSRTYRNSKFYDVNSYFLLIIEYYDNK